VRLSGTKYGCGVGGCGACTVMLSTYDPVAKKIQHHPANSCLLPICSLHGAAVTTVEGVGSIKNRINPIQIRSGLCNPAEFLPVDPTQEFIFPPELMVGRIVIGAACCLAQLRDILMETIPKLPEEKTKIYQALLQQLRTLAGEQIRSMAVLALNLKVFFPGLAKTCTLYFLYKEISYVPDHERSCYYDEFISAFRQAERQKNAFSIVNSGLRVLFSPGTDTIVDLSILYGGIGSTTLSARKSCEKLIGRQWNDQMLSEACRLVLEEISLPPSASGGKVEYRRTLLVSFLFRFYLEVLHGLHQMVRTGQLYVSSAESLHCLTHSCLQDVDPGQSPQDPVGRPIMHQSGVKHATGEAVYIDDIRPVDGELSLAVVTSIKAHAKIKSIDISEALQVPGVINVVTAKDVPGKNGNDEEEAFAEDKVICVGQIICAVVAETLTQAKCGAKKVKIAYEDLQPVLTIKDAIKHNSYITKERKLEKGDTEKGFKSADKIIEGSLCMRCVRRGRGSCAVQNLSPAASSILSISPYKFMTSVIFFLLSCGLFPAVPHHFMSSSHGISSDSYCCCINMLDNAYNIPNLRVRGHACKTNLPSNTAFRGFGFPQAGLFVETCIVAVATKTELPHEKVKQLRLPNKAVSQHFSPVCEIYPFLIHCSAWCNIFLLRMYLCNKTVAGALVHIYLDGSVLVAHGGIELGQGIHTKILQVASHELKIPLSYIHFCETSSTTVPNGKYTAGSVGTEINARAVQVRLITIFSHDHPEAHKKSMSISATGYFKGYVTNMNWETRKGHAFPYFLYGAACSEVEIDCLTGAHKNIRTDIVMDASFSINPAIDIGQVCTFMVLISTLNQFRIYDDSTLLLVFKPISPAVSLLYQGMGEAGFFLGSSVFFAVRDAVAAARKERGLPLDFTLNSPLTVERIRMACDDTFTKMMEIWADVHPGLVITWS
uniref:Aldehyde oxidase n=1 Tax=Pavo cristatus TaxID=9049 RepID=A0A8C9L858_PAVCR